MKWWLSIAVVSALLVSCSGGSNNVAPITETPQVPVTETGPPLIDSVAAVPSESYDTLKPRVSSPSKVIKTIPPKPEYAGKSFDERHRKKLEASLQNKTEQMRINDSLIAAKRRELQIEDSLKRLK